MVQDADGLVIHGGFCSIDPVVAMYVEINRPVYDPETNEFCPARSEELLEDLIAAARHHLGYGDSSMEQEYGIYVVSCMLPEIGANVAAGIWKQLRQNGVVLDEEMRYALTHVTANPEIALVVERLENVDLERAQLPGHGNGRSNHFFGAGMRTHQFENGDMIGATSS